MFVNFSKASFRLLVRALTVAIMIPSLTHGQYYTFIVTVCVFSLGQMIEYISFLERSVSKLVHIICSFGCFLAVGISVMCFIYFSSLAMTADSDLKSGVHSVEQNTDIDNELPIVSHQEDHDILLFLPQEAEDGAFISPYLVFVVWASFWVSLYYVGIDFLVWIVAILNGWKLRKLYRKSIIHV